MIRRTFLKFGCAPVLLKAAQLPALPEAGRDQEARPVTTFYEPLLWPNTPPADTPFPKSDLLKGIRFTGRHKEYTHADTWYPTWAQDGDLYSPFQDGSVDKPEGGKVEVNGGHGRNATQGYAKIVGGDPLSLSIIPLGRHIASALPYGGRYSCGSLNYNGVWYYGTYCCDVWKRTVEGVFAAWASLEPFVGFMVSRDYGRTWEETPHTPWSPLFPEVGNHSVGLKAVAEQELAELPKDWETSDVRGIIHCLPQVKIGTPHFVDFGRNMEHSPDGKAYLLGHGTIEPDPKPRFANNSWIAGDQLFMVRVTPTPSSINDVTQYEFFAGLDAQGRPTWSSEYTKIQPLIDWNNHCGCVTVTFNSALRKYLMCVADAWPGTTDMNTYILESNVLSGPWKLVIYMAKFGQQGYFVNIPSKFISEDGRKGWLCYSANYTNDWLGTKYPINPPGGRYGMSLHEFELL